MSKKFDMTLSTIASSALLLEPNLAQNIIDSIQSTQSVGDTDYHSNVANESVSYQVIGGVAVIGVDGVMYKKDISGMCMSVASYSKIVSNQAIAEADSKVKKILYRVDTSGGSVAGLEEVRSVIENSSKEVIVYAENMLCSAGMYAFTAASKIYANESTILGSIGVIVMGKSKTDDTFYIVSSNAENKNCDIGNDECKNKMQNRIDEYEDIFLEKLQLAYPKKGRDEIIEDFDRGGTIFAKTAMKLGYIDDVLPFQFLLQNLVEDDMLSSENEANNQIKSEIQYKGIGMTNEELQASLDSANSTIEAKVSEIATAQSMIQSLTDKMSVMSHAVSVGLTLGATKETVMESMEMGTKAEAELHITKSNAPVLASTLGWSSMELKSDDTDMYMDFALKHKGSVR